MTRRDARSVRIRQEDWSEFWIGYATLAQPLAPARYSRLKTRDGWSVQGAITAFHDQLRMTANTLLARPVEEETEPLAQRDLTRKLSAAIKLFMSARKQFAAENKWSDLVLLREKRLNKSVAARASSLLQWSYIRLDIHVLHMRRAFYQFDRESGILFIGGQGGSITIDDEFVFSKIYPLKPR
jgi:hypothetical protein